MRHVVVDCDCLIEVAISHQIKQRPERLVLHDFKIRFRGCETGLHVAATRKIRSFEPITAIKNFAAFVFQSLDGVLHHVDCVLVDERAHHSLSV